MQEIPPYALAWSEAFESDLDRIASRFNGKSGGHEWFDAAADALYENLQHNPFANTHQLGASDIRYIRTREHFPDSIPALYVTFRIEKPAPDGLIELRRVVTEDEIRDESLWTAIF